MNQIFNLQKADYAIRYAQVLNPDPSKVHVLFIACYANGTGLYSSIIPAMELNKTSTHQAIVNQIEEPTPQKQSNGFDVQINDSILMWADYIMFNTSFHDLPADIKAIKETNKKPNLKFGMHIDDNYHISMHGENAQAAEKRRSQLLINLAAVDIVTSPSVELIDYYANLLTQNGYELPQFQFLPNLMSNDYYVADGVTITEPKPPKLQIGMQLNPTQFLDLAPMRKVMLEILKKHSDKVEFVLFGWDGVKAKVNALQGVKFKHVKTVHIQQYFKTLANLRLDFVLMPLLDNEFNRCKSHHKLLQYAQLGIPAIVSNVKPYTDIIAKQGETIYAPGKIPAVKCNNNPDDWITKIEFMISNEGARKKMGEGANLAVQQLYTWHTNTDLLLDIFPKVLGNAKK
jgi:glycosyltransferase involved in cell wall biosynthesis